jgi:AbrB family looped-hinge helix DNA binding protein
MIYQVSITKKGQMTLPKEIRELFGIKVPDKILLKLDKKKKTIRIEALPDIMELAGKFKVEKPVDPVKIRKHMENHYARF